MRKPLLGALALALGVALFAVGGIGFFGVGSDASTQARVAAAPDAAPNGTDPLAAGIAKLQAHLRSVPKDYAGWASLGLRYVQLAKVTMNPAYYPKAEGVLRRSLSINSADNFAADAGMAALAAGRHDFTGARSWAQRGLAIDPANATLYGALGDAETQLGNYPAAFEAIQQMVDRSPDTASLSRASYAWELRGNVDVAKADMQRALEDAFTSSDRAFAHYYLGELAFNSGDATGAIAQHEAGLAADPTYAALTAGKAKAEAALGQTDAAVADYADVVSRVPQPTYLIEFGELLQSLGRTSEADQQYRLVETEQKLFTANGVGLDVDATLFAADHGDPKAALRYGEAGVRARPFLEMADAYAWALHVNGRDAEALTWSTKAMSLGMRNALFHFHAGMIERALGDAAAARTELTTALQINPHFSPLLASKARQSLQDLGGAP